MSISKEEILEAIANMSVMDVVGLIADMEEKFGVTAAAAAPVMMAAFNSEFCDSLSMTSFISSNVAPFKAFNFASLLISMVIIPSESVVSRFLYDILM